MNQTDTQKLLPCPLPTCGCEAELGRAFGDPYYVHSIECSDCGLTLSVSCVDDEPPKSLFDLWNTRLSPTGEDGLLNKKKMVDELWRHKQIMFDSGLPLSGTAMSIFGTLARRVEVGEFDTAVSNTASREGKV